jgi:AraC-like DNA-binding protein
MFVSASSKYMINLLTHKFNIPTDKEIAVKAHELITENFAKYDSVNELAKKIGTNPYKLKLVFKKNYGVSLFQFSRSERIRYAKLLLSETNYTLQVIGEMAGYTEGNNFQAAFKTMEGCTPGEFRRRQAI